ncbi:hypothetical protein CEY11_03055 [Candidimonas nitroreducens]|uniref:Uncharacterized protein n=2 Tax=Candidimonas nitroreducens TaxID=683354 RepID=A0A225MWW9_9BURK|nr:hypothetical protein CEY11_03055 [Candidimonas nitroreducens]
MLPGRRPSSRGFDAPGQRGVPRSRGARARATPCKPHAWRQRGYVLLELMLAAVLALLLAVWGTHALALALDAAAAQSLAGWMLTVRQAAQAYIERYDGTLASATDPAALADRGYVDWAAPRLAELRADGLLSRGFPELGPLGMPVSLRILRSGTACPDAGDCRIEALVYSDRPLLRRGGVDEHMLAHWLLGAQGWGGAVQARNAGQILGSAFGYDNPPAADMQPLPAGTLAMAVTAANLAHLAYLRVGDARDPDFQGQASVAGNLETRGSLRVRDYLTIEAQESADTVCSQAGAVAREYYGGLLVCRSGSWHRIGGSGGGFSLNTLYGCRNSNGVSTANPMTDACSCPGGFAMVQVSDSGNQPAPSGRTTGYLCVE